jgi:transcriptional regulator with XRE-family HTH domain
MSVYTLRQLRKAAGFTVAEVGALAGHGQSWASKVERGQIRNLESLRAYLGALGWRLQFRAASTLDHGPHGSGGRVMSEQVIDLDLSGALGFEAPVKKGEA